jgi:dTMP kinase
MKKGKLIVFEGIAGSGHVLNKYIQIVHRMLSGAEREVVECCNTDSGRLEDIGATGAIDWNFGQCDRADFAFECAVRTQLCESLIHPALSADKIVICKHFSISSLANMIVKGHGKEIDALRLMDKMSRGNLFGVGREIYPDLTIFLDIPISDAHERCEDILRAHHGGMDFYEKMRKFYLSEIRRWNGVRINANASRPEETVIAEISNEIQDIL